MFAHVIWKYIKDEMKTARIKKREQATIN